jgi:hypothetical protein
MRIHLAAVLAAAVGWTPAVAVAGQAEDAPRGVSVGALKLTPSVDVSQIGYDSNIFNDAVNPRGDMSMQIVPASDFVLRLGRARLSGRSAVSFTYFREYTTQRSFDTSQEAAFEIDLNRVTPRVTATYVSGKQRQGLDIDVRVRRTRVAASAGFAARVSPKVQIGAEVTAGRDAFDDAAIADGVRLHDTLTRRLEGAVADVSYAITPLTTIVVPVQVEREDFLYDPIRGSTSVRVAPRVEFKPTALIAGSASVGYRRVTPTTAFVEEFSGLVGAVDLAYTLHGSTRLSLNAGRDLEYSFRPDFPSFLVTGVGLSVRQRLTRSWDAHGSFGRLQLDYRRLVIPITAPGSVAGAAPLNARTEGWTYGAGLGYRVGQNSRVEFEVTRSMREAAWVGRDFDGWRAGTSIFYGF